LPFWRRLEGDIHGPPRDPAPIVPELLNGDWLGPDPSHSLDVE
jgi:hypothetical protein